MNAIIIIIIRIYVWVGNCHGLFALPMKVLLIGQMDGGKTSRWTYNEQQKRKPEELTDMKVVRC